MSPVYMKVIVPGYLPVSWYDAWKSLPLSAVFLLSSGLGHYRGLSDSLTMRTDFWCLIEIGKSNCHWESLNNTFYLSVVKISNAVAKRAYVRSQMNSTVVKVTWSEILCSGSRFVIFALISSPRSCTYMYTHTHTHMVEDNFLCSSLFFLLMPQLLSNKTLETWIQPHAVFT